MKTNLGSEQSKSRRDSGFEYTEEETHGNGARKVLDARQAGKDGTPHDDVERRVLGKWQTLQQTVRRIFPGQVP